MHGKVRIRDTTENTSYHLLPTENTERIQDNKHIYTSGPHYDKFIKEANKNSVQHLLT